MAARVRSINLLPKSEFEISFWGRFLKWSLTAGRYIIILTELVVIMAFMSRFKLDQDLQSLGDNIEGKKRILESMAGFEKTFRTTQERLALAGKLIDGSPNAGGAIENLVGKLPNQVSLTDLSFNEGEVTITGKATGEQDLGIFLTRIGTDNMWKNLTVTEVSADAGGIKFGLKVKK